MEGGNVTENQCHEEGNAGMSKVKSQKTKGKGGAIARKIGRSRKRQIGETFCRVGWCAKKRDVSRFRDDPWLKGVWSLVRQLGRSGRGRRRGASGGRWTCGLSRWRGRPW